MSLVRTAILCPLLAAALGTPVWAQPGRDPGAPAQASAVDPRLVGTWTASVPTPQGTTALWVWEIRADGTYSARTEGQTPAVAHRGRVSFANGQWTLRATEGLQNWSDQGTYQVVAPNMMLVVGKLGPGYWQRPAGGTAPAVASSWPRTLPEMARRARVMAQGKRRDAFLYEMRLNRQLPTLAAPTQEDYDYRFSFYSPGDQFTLSVTPNNQAGEIWPGGRHDLSDRRPIPDRFLDFADAEKRAQLLGMRGKAERAVLSFHRSDAWPTWTIWPVSARRTFVLNASAAMAQGKPPLVTAGEPLRERVVGAAPHLAELTRELGKVARTVVAAPVQEQRAAGITARAVVVLDRVAKGGGTDSLQDEAAVLIYRDRAAAEDDVARRQLRLGTLTTHGPPRRWTDSGIGTVELRCAAGFTTGPDRRAGSRCIYLHPTLPVLAAGSVEIELSAGLSSDELNELIDRAFSLCMAAVFYLADVLHE